MARDTKKVPPRKRRTAPGTPTEKRGTPIDHGKVMDGHGRLAGRSSYVSFVTPCVVCGTPFAFTGTAQKYVLEVKGVPVKALRGSAFCARCMKRRGRIHALGRHPGKTHVERSARAAERRHLVAEERTERSMAGAPTPTEWPY